MVSWHKCVEEETVEQDVDKILMSGMYRHTPSPGVMDMEGGFSLTFWHRNLAFKF
jgi:hypothetical protein